MRDRKTPKDGRGRQSSSRRFVYVDFRVKRRQDSEVRRVHHRDVVKTANRPGILECGDMDEPKPVEKTTVEEREVRYSRFRAERKEILWSDESWSEENSSQALNDSGESSRQVNDMSVATNDLCESSQPKNKRNFKPDSKEAPRQLKKVQICWKCRQPGHKYAECKNSTVKPLTRKQCIICKIRGHIADDCPTAELRVLLMD